MDLKIKLGNLKELGDDMAKNVKKKVSKKISQAKDTKVYKKVVKRVEKKLDEFYAKNKGAVSGESMTEALPGVREEIDSFMKRMKDRGVVMNIQYENEDKKAVGADRGACLTTMLAVKALGHLSYARLVTESGVLVHQNFDSLVQVMEQNPDLVQRLHKTATIPTCEHSNSDSKVSDETGGC